MVVSRNLDENTRSVYKENVRLSEALHLHVTSEEKLKKTVNHLQTVTSDFQSEKDLHDVLVQEKIVEAKRQKNHIKKVEIGKIQLHISNIKIHIWLTKITMPQHTIQTKPGKREGKNLRVPKKVESGALLLSGLAFCVLFIINN